jgi:dTDP-glucose pyrophosphorylase
MKLEKMFLRKDDSVRKAIGVLNKSKCQIILVIDKNKKLIGTVTDGDIRRSIAKGNTLDCDLKKLMNKAPIKVKENENFSNIQKIMKNNSILQIPEVNKNGKVIKLHFWNSKLKSKNKKNVFFILAGGKGKRLWPLTKNTPKPMLKVKNKPMLENLINDAKNFGFNNFIISVNYKREKIIHYFKNGKNLNVIIRYISEKKPLGTAGSLSMLKKNMKLPIIITNGDIHTKVNFSELLDFHNKNKAFATVVVKQVEKMNSFGVVKTKGIIFKDFIEKPIEKININTGIYVLNPNIIKIIPKRKIDMPEVLIKLRDKKKKIIIFPVHEEWSDLGIKKDLRAKQNRKR